jgi:serine-type D-Ala-D-Ala endopeptidase (penicillin-binding protein 7)
LRFQWNRCNCYTPPRRKTRTLIRLTSRALLRFLPTLIVLASLSAPCLAARKHHAPAGQPDLRSNAVLVFDEGSSKILLSRQAEVSAPIASITKLMTALVVLDGRQPLDEVVQITDADRERGRGSFSRLAIGTKLTRGDLLHLALMSSENRAAHALGRTYPGGLTAFVKAMNERAHALGMSGAHFVDPTGLSDENVASPADLSKLVIEASHEPTIQQYSTDERHSIRVGRKTLEFHNTDQLVRSPAWNIIVQKTGYITEAGRCLVIKALIRGRAIVIVLLDSFGRYTRTADAQRIRKWLEAMPAEVLLAG